MTFQALKFPVIAAAIAATLWGGYDIGRSVDQSPAATTPTVVRKAGQPYAAASLPDFGSIVESYGPAVVNISVEGTVKTAARGRTPLGQLDPDDPFSEFFRRFAPRGQGKPGEQITHGQGSGFIVSTDGIVLTNAHVVANADNVTVKLTDKREFTAKVIGIDKPTDIAVLRIDAQDLPTVPLGDPGDIRVGDWVLAIGSPFGFENSVTAGIVSAKSRSLPDEGYVPFIQTDVAINPGNSGGPLLNLKGEVVGINSQIYSQSGGYQGLSFAIPISVAAHVKEQLLAQGKVTRGRLGIAIQDLNQGLADSFGLTVARGALVSHVEPGSPAATAGIEPGDVVLKFNGEAIASSAELPPRVAVIPPGKPAKLEIWRKRKAQEITVTVGEQQPEKVAAAETPPDDGGRLGVSVRPLTADEQKEAETRGGLLVLDSYGPAARAGIEEGDVILAVNGKHVNRVDELRKQLTDAGKHVALLIQRGDARIFVPIELG